MHYDNKYVYTSISYDIHAIRNRGVQCLLYNVYYIMSTI